MLTSIDRSIKFRSLVIIKGRKSQYYFQALDVIFRVYNGAGFQIKHIQCDKEFQPLMNDVKDELEVTMNYANPKDHVPEAERNNRTIQERVRVGYHRLPYNRLPLILVKPLALISTNMLNMFPVKGGVSSYYSPHMIMQGRKLDYNKHCQVPFGAYVQVNNEPDFTNTMARILKADTP